MIYFIIFLFLPIAWLAYEAWRAPLIDNNHNIIRPAKSFRDLFKKKKNNKNVNEWDDNKVHTEGDF
jgi:hypothetical protein